MENYQYMENFNPNTSSNEGVNPQRVGETSIQPQMPIEAQDTRHVRKEQVDELREKTQEIYSQVIDSMIDSRDEKGQYFGILGNKNTETGVDQRIIILPNPVMIDGQPKGLLAITTDGALLLKDKEWDTKPTIGSQNPRKLPWSEEMQMQIDAFYGKGNNVGGYNLENSFYDNSLDRKQIIFYNFRAIDAGKQSQDVEPIDNLEIVAETIKNNQEKAESPFRGQYQAQQQKLEQANNLFNVVNSLPPKE